MREFGAMAWKAVRTYWAGVVGLCGIVAVIGRPEFVDPNNTWQLAFLGFVLFILGCIFGWSVRSAIKVRDAKADHEAEMDKLRFEAEREDAKRDREAAEAREKAETVTRERKAKADAERERNERALVGIVRTMGIYDKEFVARLYFDGPKENGFSDGVMNERHHEAFRFLRFESLPELSFRWDLTDWMRGFLARHEDLLEETHEAYLAKDARDRERREAAERKYQEKQANPSVAKGKRLSTGGKQIGSTGIYGGGR